MAAVVTLTGLWIANRIRKTSLFVVSHCDHLMYFLRCYTSQFPRFVLSAVSQGRMSHDLPNSYRFFSCRGNTIFAFSRRFCCCMCRRKLRETNYYNAFSVICLEFHNTVGYKISLYEKSSMGEESVY